MIPAVVPLLLKIVDQLVGLAAAPTLAGRVFVEVMAIVTLVEVPVVPSVGLVNLLA
jgi:hypothetical protein